jgi:hypothetical protein
VFVRKAKTPSGQMIAEFAHQGNESDVARIVLVVSPDGSAKIVSKNKDGEKTTHAVGTSAARACMRYDDFMNGYAPRVFFDE